MGEGRARWPKAHRSSGSAMQQTCSGVMRAHWTACRLKRMMMRRMIQWKHCTILTGRTEPWLRYFPSLRLPSTTSAILTTSWLNRVTHVTVFTPLTSSWNRRRITPPAPRRNQGGFYDILQQVAIGSSRSGVLLGGRRLSLAE